MDRFAILIVTVRGTKLSVQLRDEEILHQATKQRVGEAARLMGCMRYAEYLRPCNEFEGDCRCGEPCILEPGIG